MHEGKIYWGDCLDVMQDMAPCSVDLIVTSPPYGNKRKQTYGGVDPDRYVEWFLPRAKEMQRVLKPTGSFVLNIKEGCKDGERLLYVCKLKIALVEEQNWRLVDEFIWNKIGATPGYWHNRFRDAWERLMHFTKDKGFKMNQDAVMVESDYKQLHITKRVKVSNNSGHTSTRGKKGKGMVYPSNVLRGPIGNGCKGYNHHGHSAVYPEYIPEFFIKLFSDEGDTVLDPFLGSGTTIRVAKRLGRKGIGIEKKEDTNIVV